MARSQRSHSIGLRTLLALNSLSWVAALALLVMVWWDTGSVSDVYRYSLVAVIYFADVLARERLWRAVRTAERSGFEARRLSGLRLRHRMYEFMARRCEITESRRLAQAAAAEARGDHKAADRYHTKAENESKWAEKCRTAAKDHRNTVL